MSHFTVTYLHEFESFDDRTRPYIFQEFASHGAKHMVLSDTLLKQIFARPAQKQMMVDELASFGMSFKDAHNIFGRYLDLNCPVPEARPEMLSRLKLTLEIIASIGIDTITIHTGNEVYYPEYPLEIQFEYIKRSLDELLPVAEKLGVTICIENIWCQINTPERLLAIKECFPTDALGFCYDAGHANLMDKGRNFPNSNPYQVWNDITPAWDDQILEKMLPHVVNCHLHDNDGISDKHRNIGNGTIDWNHIIPLLKSAPRLKVIQSEVIPIRANASIKDICSKFNELFG